MVAALWLYKEPGDSIAAPELRYSIRSAVRHWGVDEVWLIGERPEWAVNVGHIPGAPDTGSKYRTLFADLLTACKSAEVPDEFVLMNDDFHVLRPYEPAVEHRGELSGHCPGEGAFRAALEDTLDWLRDSGHDAPLSYELHRPLPIRKGDAAAALDLARLHGLPLHARTVYGAVCDIGGELAADRKLIGLHRIEGDAWQALDVVSTSESAWQGYVGDWLRLQSPDPSPFER